jgi:hypothetical protein
VAQRNSRKQASWSSTLHSHYWATWIGTVLAYYFSRKNFESANQSVECMVTLTADQKLGLILVEKEMLRPGQITLYQIPAGKTPKDVLLKDLRSRISGKIIRLPIVDSNGAVLYIVHQSGLFKFVAEQAMAGKAADIDKLTLQDLEVWGAGPLSSRMAYLRL